MWCYNIIGDNDERISYLLQLGPINPGSVLLTTNTISLKRENPEPIIIVKII